MRFARIGRPVHIVPSRLKSTNIGEDQARSSTGAKHSSSGVAIAQLVAKDLASQRPTATGPMHDLTARGIDIPAGMSDGAVARHVATSIRSSVSQSKQGTRI